MKNCVLSFDTSNYKTSAAVYCIDSGEYQSEGRLLSVSEGSLGLRQSDALFLHVKALPEIVKLLDLYDKRIVAIAASGKPRDAENSYMPCFLAGLSFGKSMASVLSVPFFEFSHQHGHIASAAFSAGRFDLLKKPFYAWHLSGGTTELLKVSPNKSSFSVKIIGGTSDISAGQLIDRCGVSLNMLFPSGVFVEKEALLSEKTEKYKVKVNDMRFSLSGMENKINKMIADKAPSCDICAFTLNTVAYAVKTATEQALSMESLPVLVSGGVSVCSFVKNAFSDKENIIFAQKGLGGDNALGAALLCAEAVKL